MASIGLPFALPSVSPALVLSSFLIESFFEVSSEGDDRSGVSPCIRAGVVLESTFLVGERVRNGLI